MYNTLGPWSLLQTKESYTSPQLLLSFHFHYFLVLNQLYEYHLFCLNVHLKLVTEVSTYETRASSKNSLSSSKSHALLMIRPERHWNTIWFRAWWLASFIRLCDSTSHYSMIVLWEMVGTILSLCHVNCQKANEKAEDNIEAATDSYPWLTSGQWQPPVSPVSAAVAPFLLYITKFHVWCHHFKCLLMQLLCFQWTPQPVLTLTSNPFREFTWIIFNYLTTLQYKQQTDQCYKFGTCTILWRLQDCYGAILSFWRN